MHVVYFPIIIIKITTPHLYNTVATDLSVYGMFQNLIIEPVKLVLYVIHPTQTSSKLQ